MSKEHLRLPIGSPPRFSGDQTSAVDIAPNDTHADDVKRQLEVLCRGFQSFCDEIGIDPSFHTSSLIVRRFSVKFKGVQQEFSLTFKAGLLIINDFYDRNPGEEALKSTSIAAFSRRLVDISNRAFGPIDNEDNSKAPISRQAELSRLDEFEQALNADGHDGAAIRKLAEKLFPELKHDAARPSASSYGLALPTEAPEIYQGLRGPETPPEFVKRVYGPWLGQGLTRADIRKLDPKLSVAITNWLSRPGNEWPADVDLPTKAEQNERLLSAGPDAIREHLGKFTGQEALREAARINAAAHYRK